MGVARDRREPRPSWRRGRRPSRRRGLAPPRRPSPGCGGRRSSWGSAASRSTSPGLFTMTPRDAASRSRRRPGRPCAARSRRRPGSPPPTPAPTSYSWWRIRPTGNRHGKAHQSFALFVFRVKEIVSHSAGTDCSCTVHDKIGVLVLGFASFHGAVL